eukprot:tig00020560_g11080.t1
MAARRLARSLTALYEPAVGWRQAVTSAAGASARASSSHAAASSSSDVALRRSLAVLAAAVAGWGAMSTVQRAHADKKQAGQEQDEEFDVAAELASMSPDARWLLYSQKGQEEAKAGRLAEAERLFERACEEAEKSFPRLDPRVPASYNNLAEVCKRQRRDGPAERAYERALALYIENDGRDSNTAASVMFNLGSLLILRREFGRAEAMHREALGVRRVALHPDHPHIAQSLYQLALCLQAQGRFPEAEGLVEESLRVVRARPQTASPLAIRLRLQKLAQLALQRGDPAAALRAQQRVYSFETEERSTPREDPSLDPILIAIADTQRALGRPAEAEATYRRVLAAVEKRPGGGAGTAESALLQGRIAAALAARGRRRRRRRCTSRRWRRWRRAWGRRPALRGGARPLCQGAAGLGPRRPSRRLGPRRRGRPPRRPRPAPSQPTVRARPRPAPAPPAPRAPRAPRADAERLQAAAEAVPVLRSAAQGCAAADLATEAAALREAAAAAEAAASAGAAASPESAAAAAAAAARWGASTSAAAKP